MVGATAAYALVMQGVRREIVLVDKNEAQAAAETDDILHAVPLAVRAGGYVDLVGCRVVVFCARSGKEKFRNQQIECQNYAHQHGVDKPEAANWKWPY